MSDLNEMNCTRYGTGPERSVCLFMHGNTHGRATGIGDDMHAAPVIWQMVRDGYDVTIYCRGPHDPFNNHIPFWQALGVQHVHEWTPAVMNLAFLANEGHKYRRMISLIWWGTWEEMQLGVMKRDRIKQFADIIGARIPEEFSWADVFQPLIEQYPKRGDYILYAPFSAEVWRSMPEPGAQQLYDELSEQAETLWLTDGHPDRAPNVHAIKAESLAELLSLVYHARYIVAVDNGVSNIAGAFARPLTSLSGMTDPALILGAYQRFNRDWRYTVVRGAQPYGCSMPCYRHPDRGFFGISEEGLHVRGGVHGSKCLGVNDEPLCMKHLPLDTIIQDFISKFISTDNSTNKGNDICRSL